MSSEEINTLDTARESIRLMLNGDKIKLWLPPYTFENGQKGDRPNELICQYSVALGLPVDLVATIIEELRLHSIKKLTDRRAGIATLSIKFAGYSLSSPNNSDNPSSTSLSASKELSIEISLKSKGVDLKRQILLSSGMTHDCLKLISSGRVIDNDVTLEQQQIGHNSHILALCLSAPSADSTRQQEQLARVARVRQAADIISSRSNDDNRTNYHMQIADQSGKAVELPSDERKALMLAMVLHEKGRSALKCRQFGEALVFLLEADNEFKKCRSSVLNMVDNYAIVCLDIVWCYLCLQDISALPDAEMRLNACESCFQRSYGTNLERLAVVKGGTYEEAALFVRLHLLQGVLAFHQQRNEDARILLQKAESELSALRTSDQDMMQLMEMGFTELEARLGLRSCQGNITHAVTAIMQRREEKRLQVEKAREDSKRKKLERTLGKTISGNSINIEHYYNLVSVGFAKGAAAEALRQSDNDITLAFQILHEKPELRSLPDPQKKFIVSDAMIGQLTAMGFDSDTALAALHHFDANIDRAVEELLHVGGIVPADWLKSLPPAYLPSSASPSSNSGSDVGVASSSLTQEELRQRELVEEIIPDISHSDEDYLDLALDDEAAILKEYQARLASFG